MGKGGSQVSKKGHFLAQTDHVRLRRMCVQALAQVLGRRGPEGAGGEDTAVWAVDRKCCGLRPPLGFGDVGLSQKVSCRSCRGIETWDRDVGLRQKVSCKSCPATDSDSLVSTDSLVPNVVYSNLGVLKT